MHFLGLVFVQAQTLGLELTNIMKIVKDVSNSLN